jgi:hypothetical protein
MAMCAATIGAAAAISAYGGCHQGRLLVLLQLVS